MQTFYSFIVKEFLHIFRDTRTMLILLVLPIVQILLFGFAISTEVKNTQVAVLDYSKDLVTQRIVQQIHANPAFEVTHHARNMSEVDRLFRNGAISLAIIFSENFAAQSVHSANARVQLIADGSEPNQAQMAVGYASALLESELSTDDSLPYRISTRYLFNPQAQSAYNFVPGVMGMILLIVCSMMTSVSIVREKETGSMEILLASPTPPLSIVLAKAIPFLLLSCMNLATILLLSKFVLGVPIRGHLLLLLAICMLYIMLALSLGLFISNLVRTQMAAVLISGMGLIMPTMILSGMLFPIESMPTVLQYVSAIVPARWFIAAIHKVMIQGVGFSCITKEIFILSGMTVVLIATSVKQFKVRLK